MERRAEVVAAYLRLASRASQVWEDSPGPEARAVCEAIMADAWEVVAEVCEWCGDRQGVTLALTWLCGHDPAEGAAVATGRFGRDAALTNRHTVAWLCRRRDLVRRMAERMGAWRLDLGEMVGGRDG